MWSTTGSWTSGSCGAPVWTPRWSTRARPRRQGREPGRHPRTAHCQGIGGQERRQAEGWRPLRIRTRRRGGHGPVEGRHPLRGGAGNHVGDSRSGLRGHTRDPPRHRLVRHLRHRLRVARQARRKPRLVRPCANQRHAGSTDGVALPRVGGRRGCETVGCPKPHPQRSSSGERGRANAPSLAPSRTSSRRAALVASARPSWQSSAAWRR